MKVESTKDEIKYISPNIANAMLADVLSLEDLEGEIWKDIIGFDGSHSVSNFGRVKREQRYDTKGRLLKAKILKRQYWIGKDGFVDGAKVTFGADGKVITKAVSILVAESFLGEIPKGYCVVHLDKNVKNDCVDNLKITTYSESLIRDYSQFNKYDWGFGEKGNEGRNKIVEQLDLDGNVIAEFESLGEIERKFNYKKQTISDMCRGRWKDKPHYTAYGYRWRFKHIS
jgi:hypothetical protein